MTNQTSPTVFQFAYVALAMGMALVMKRIVNYCQRRVRYNAVLLFISQ